MEYGVRPLLLSLAVAVFVGAIGAFGTDSVPLGWRVLTFAFLGLGITLEISICVWATQKIPWLLARPLIRRIVIAAAMTPLSGLWVWSAVGFAFLGGPKLSNLPIYLGYSLLMAAAMSTLSWAVFRQRTAGAPGPPPLAPKFMERLPFRLREAALYAVEAEDHYLRVRTSKGSELILMRFSDALSELRGMDGAQTHRSWWVARAGVADVRRSDGRAVLALKDGAEAPVSRTQAKALRELGWI
jgi:hypothetical protein